MIQKYFFHNKANYNSKETKITSMTKKSHRAPTCAELGPAQPQLVDSLNMSIHFDGILTFHFEGLALPKPLMLSPK